MAHVEKCPVCEGRGYVQHLDNPGLAGTQTAHNVPCHGCGGKGWVTVEDGLDHPFAGMTAAHIGRTDLKEERGMTREWTEYDQALYEVVMELAGMLDDPALARRLSETAGRAMVGWEPPTVARTVGRTVGAMMVAEAQAAQALRGGMGPMEQEGE